MEKRYQTIIYSRMYFYIQVFVLPGAQPIICHWIVKISNRESWGASQRTQIKTLNQVPFARDISEFLRHETIIMSGTNT